jgi:hypothetical protein
LREPTGEPTFCAVLPPRRSLRRLVEIDLRSLALFRIGLAAAVLLDVASRARSLTAHYTDLGVLPREVLAAGLRPSLGGLVATLWPGGTVAAGLFLAIYAAAALLLLVGFRTRAATALCWVGTLGLLARNPLVLHRADTLLKMLLFWGMFLPLAARLSVDRRLARDRSDEQPADAVASPASAALLLQPCLMFWFAVLSRSPVEWWQQGSALYYASHCDIIARPLGAALRDLPPRALAALTRAVIVAEAALPLVLWSPWATRWLRTAGVAFLVLMPAAFGLAFNIGYFPLMCVVAVLPFLPGRLWTRRRRTDGAEAETFDGAPRRTGRFAPRWVGALAAGLLLCSLALNLDAHTSRFVIARPLRAAGVFAGLDQRWDIFAPAPPKEDEWFAVLGLLRDGSVVDLMHEGAAPSLDKPADFDHYWTDYRWRRYWFNLRNFPTLHGRYVAYAAREWDRAHPGTRQLEAVRIELVRERTPPFGGAGIVPPLERETVWPAGASVVPAVGLTERWERARVLALSP